MMEQALRQGLMMSRGEFGIFLSRPISATMLAVAALVLLGHLFSVIRRAHTQRGQKRADGLSEVVVVKGGEG
jgi:putative tricarboxylic transport membrane protein